MEHGFDGWDTDLKGFSLSAKIEMQGGREVE
jgi:hypothetical protein